MSSICQACASARRRLPPSTRSRARTKTLGLFGTGKQARNALEAIEVVRPINQVNVYSPHTEHREAFRAGKMSRNG